MKLLKSTLVLLMCCALFQNAFGQLSGSYTIGGTTPDYATIPAAVTALQTSGVSAAVTFNIRPGLYTGKIDIGTVPGISAVNNVTFKAENNDSTSVILEDTAGVGSNFLWHIFGTDHLIIRNLTLRRIGPDAASCVFSIALNSRFLQIRNCIIEASSILGSDEQGALIYFPLGGASDSSITFSNNIFNGGTIGIYMNGQNASSLIPNSQLNDNEFNNQSIAGMQLSLMSAPSILRNTINATTTDFGFTGIEIENSRFDIKILSNVITQVKNSGDCITLTNCDGSSSNRILIANNFLQTEGSGGTGITILSSSNLNIYYNSVNITSTGTSDAGLFIDNTNTDSLVNIKNNIFINTGAGVTVYIIDSISLVSIESSDYNNLWVGPSNANFATVKGVFVQDFAEYLTASGMDSHSVSGDPQFISVTDLHVGNPLVNDAGIFVTGVTTDIDGQNRSVTTPDIGADEFLPLNNNLSFLGFASPQNGICGDSSIFFEVVIRNLGLATQTSFPIHLELTGAVTQSITQNYSGSIATNANDTVLINTPLNIYSGGTVNVTGYLSLTNDQYRLNDTVHTSFIFVGHPNSPTVVSPQSHCDNNLMISATPDTIGDVLVWFADATGGSPLGIGDVFSPVVTTDTTFYVESRGPGPCLRITEFEPDDNPSDFLEIENLSNSGFDATGWQVVVNDLNDDTVAMAQRWNLGYFNPGETQYKTDNASDSYWGVNLPWVGGFGSWIMLLDNFGDVVDFVIWDWDSTLSVPIPSMVINVDGRDYHVADYWSGPPIITCSSDGTQRIGSNDNDNASDWGCAPGTKGFHNSNLSSVFSSCGIGACGSTRVPIDVTLVPGVSFSLGNDTMVGQPFFIDLDPGPGFTSYQWSTGHTSQSITVSSYDTYWVTVVGGPNNCSFTDSIVISLNVGVNDPISSEEIFLYPNPSNDIITISGKNSILKSATVRIRDIDGRLVDVPGLDSRFGELTLDVKKLTPGIYFIQVTSGNRMGVKRFAVIK